MYCGERGGNAAQEVDPEVQVGGGNRGCVLPSAGAATNCHLAWGHTCSPAARSEGTYVERAEKQEEED